MLKMLVVLVAVTAAVACGSEEINASKAVCEGWWTLVDTKSIYTDFEIREQLKELNDLSENASPEIRQVTFDMLAAATKIDTGSFETAKNSLGKECAEIGIGYTDFLVEEAIRERK